MRTSYGERGVSAYKYANFWETEASYNVGNNGGVSGLRYGIPFTRNVGFATPKSGTMYQVHIHPKGGIGFDWFGPTDLYDMSNERGSYQYQVVGEKNIYTISRDQIIPLRTDLMKFGTVRGGHYYSDPSTAASYGAWSQAHGINSNASLHGFNFSTHNLYWFGR